MRRFQRWLTSFALVLAFAPAWRATAQTGACCEQQTGTCSVLTPVDCAALVPAGVYLGDDSVCPAGLCATGACCVSATDACIIKTAVDCAALPGRYLGNYSTCTTGSFCLGACCEQSTGACSIRTATSCAGLASPGTYLGDNIACPPIGKCLAEHEPNSVRADAAGFGVTMAPGDSIAGFSKGTSLTAGSAATTTGDLWDITTTAAPAPGIYRYRLMLTFTDTLFVGSTHNTFIQGLQQSAGVINTNPATQDRMAQIGPQTATFTGTLPPRGVQWYANQDPSRIYYRVTGAGFMANGAYTVTLQRDLVSLDLGNDFTNAMVYHRVPSPIDAGPVLVTSQGITTTDTNVAIYDSSFNPVVDPGNFIAGNENATNPNDASTTTSCRLQRTLAPGTYYAAVGVNHMANNLASPPDDRDRSQTVVDFSNALVSKASAVSQDCTFQIGNRCSGAMQTITNFTSSDPFHITLWEFTVAAPALPEPSFEFSRFSVSPSFALIPGATTTLTVFTKNGTPTSVTGDLTAFGLSAAVPFVDSGTNTSGERLWTYVLTIPNDQPANRYGVIVKGPSGSCVDQTITVSFTVSPINNSCSRAIPIAIGSSTAGSTLFASGSGAFPQNCGEVGGGSAGHSGVWYTFTEGSTPHRLSANLCDPLTDFDAMLVVYSGGCPGGSTCVWGNTSSPVGCVNQSSAREPTDPILTSHTDTPAVLYWNPDITAGQCTIPGTTYYIVVVNQVNTVGGHFVLHLDDTGEICPAAPAKPYPSNQTACTAKSLTTFPYWEVVFRGDSVTPSPQIPSCAGGGVEAHAPIWYAFTPSEPGNFFHAKIPDQGITGMSTDSIVSVYSGTDCDALSAELACIDFVDGYLNSFTTAVLHMSAGITYFALVSNSYPSFPNPERIGFNFVADPGACCNGASCTITNGSAACVSGGGAFKGYATTCDSADICTVTSVRCCRGTTCNEVAVGSCTGTVAGSASITVSSCGPGNALATCCYADFNHDGIPSIDDLFLYFNAYFTGSPWANVGGDGVQSPTIDDLFLYINAYFTGCS